MYVCIGVCIYIYIYIYIYTHKYCQVEALAYHPDAKSVAIGTGRYKVPPHRRCVFLCSVSYFSLFIEFFLILIHLLSRC